MRDEVLEVALKARVIFVMGGVDTGKTTVVRNLANELFRRGYSVGVIDADVGQSDIGPPTTIGLGTVESGLEHLGDAVLQCFYFVGSTSPKGHLLPIIIGARKMLDKAFALGLQKILFDTTGLISGQLGRVLKEHKIEMINPDVIICLQTRNECEHILQTYSAFERPIVLRLAPDNQCRKKTPENRRNYRETALRKHFAQAKEIECSLSEIGIFGTTLFNGQPLSSEDLQALSKKLDVEARDLQPQESKNNAPQPEIPDLQIELADSQRATRTPQLVSRNLRPATRNAHPVSQILWGEYIGRELYVITSQPLRYPQILTLKRGCPEIDYIRNETSAEFENILVGILDNHNEYLALGILRSLDFDTQRAVIYTPAPQEAITGVKFSRSKMAAM